MGRGSGSGSEGRDGRRGRDEEGRRDGEVVRKGISRQAEYSGNRPQCTAQTPSTYPPSVCQCCWTSHSLYYTVHQAVDRLVDYG